MAALAHEAADAGAQLVLFSETALTGFVATGDATHDLPLAESIPGPATDRLGALARERGIWLGFGMYERERADGADRLYDAVVLLDPGGAVRLRYRRITPQWHWPHDDPAVYRQGGDVAVATTPVGRGAFLLCGDLFSPPLIRRVRVVRPDLLLVPFARRYDSEVADAGDWERRERLAYAAQAREAGCPALLVNYLADSPVAGGCFGGALAVSAAGEVAASLPPGREGILLVDGVDEQGRAVVVGRAAAPPR